MCQENVIRRNKGKSSRVKNYLSLKKITEWSDEKPCLNTVNMQSKEGWVSFGFRSVALYDNIRKRHPLSISIWPTREETWLLFFVLFLSFSSSRTPRAATFCNFINSLSLKSKNATVKKTCFRLFIFEFSALGLLRHHLPACLPACLLVVFSFYPPRERIVQRENYLKRWVKHYCIVFPFFLFYSFSCSPLTLHTDYRHPILGIWPSTTHILFVATWCISKR